jgi:putative membrane protein
MLGVVMPHSSSLAVLLGAGAGGAWALRTVVRRSLLRPWWGLAGVAVLVLSLAGPLDRLGEERSIAAHVVQHLLLISAAPALVLVAARPALRRVPGPPSPSLAAGLLVGSCAVVWLVHLPFAMDATVRAPLLNDGSHLVLLLAGLALSWPLAAPQPLPGLSAVAYLGVAELLIGALGLLLTWYQGPLYDAYAAAVPLFGMDRATDQALAGALLLVIEEPFLAVEVAVLFIAALDDGDDDGP